MTDLEYALQPRTLRPANRVAVLRDGSETFPAMLDAIAHAREYVHLEVYILQSDTTGRRFADALAERARAGLAVRLLYDAIGSLGLDGAYIADLRTAGVEVIEFNPIKPWRRRFSINRRDHKKILVVDGTVGFVGGLNVGDEYVPVEQGGGGWHDLHARVEGPAVAELARAFRRTWIEAGGAAYLQTEEPAEESVASDASAFALALTNDERRRRASIRATYLYAIRRARRAIRIMSAYFIPDRGIRRQLANAVARGVKVSVIVPANSDLKSTQFASQRLFHTLLKMGVKILEWPARMMHAKTVVVDGAWATIGSYNLDHRSLFHNLEVALIVVDRPFARGMEAQYDADAARCHEVTLAAWKKRPLWRRVAEWFFHLFRHWM